jgi:phage tail sheath protein FI
MPQYFTPGVYIEEIERGPRPIEGVPTSIAAFLGETERGPTMPQEVTSYRDYQRWFGDLYGDRTKYMPFAVNGFFENGGQLLYVSRIVGAKAATASKVFGDFTVSAAGPGLSGKNVWAKIDFGTTKVKDSTGKMVSAGFMLKLAYWQTLPGTLFDPFDPANANLTPRPQYQELFDDLSVDPNSIDYFERRLNDNAALGTIARTKGNGTLPTNDSGVLAGGNDDAIVKADFDGDPAGNRTTPQGLAALLLDPYRDVAILHAPFPGAGPNPVGVAQSLIAHCEQQKFRFAVIDCNPNTAPGDASLDPRSVIQDTEYAAFYYPWLTILDPQTNAPRNVPPGGYAVGVYARTDNARGVFKAPANEVVEEVIKLEQSVNDNQQFTLNPRGVNCIRSFAGRGIRIWGARTMSSDGLWKYVSVRRLFIFLERSIYEGTQWVVFEPNDQRLWARVKDSVRLFLRTQWRQGALMGATEDQAFFITCDTSTMTPDDILNGRLICEIGIAPVRPAEFVIFRIFQNTADPQQ